jgi:hypothetical protein
MMKAKITLLILLLNSAFFFAQAVVDLPITIGNGAGSSQVLHLGLDPTATDGIDAGLGEAALVAPGVGVFDARLILPSGTDASLKDFRTGNGTFVGTKTHTVQFQPGAGSTITLVWNFPAGISGRLQDVISGNLIDVSMSGSSAYTIFNPTVYNTLRITMNYNLNPAGVPSIPVLSSPANLAAGISTSPTLSWVAAAGATTYTLQVSTVNTFASFVYNQSGLGGTTQAVAGLTGSTTYFWRVSATNVNGTSDYSAVSSFTTAGSAPPTPLLNTPTDGAIDIDLNPTLTWNASAGATSYNLQVSLAYDFSSIVTEQTGIGITSYAVAGLVQGLVYYWRVSATSVDGTSAYSAPRSFKTQITGIPSVPNLLTPVNGATEVSPNPVLTWSNTGGAITYNLVVATDSWFTQIVNNVTGLTTTSYRLSNLTLGGRYYWKVLATNSFGSSMYSEQRQFNVTSIPPVPDAPILGLPANGATGVSPNAVLIWSTAPGAASYNVQVSTVSDFSTTVVNQTGITTTTYTAAGLLLNTQYYWKVQAVNITGSSPFSGVWTFTTSSIPLVPPVPVLISPADSSLNIALRPTLTWSASSGATRYRLLISKSVTFADTVVNDTNVVTTSFTIVDSLIKGTSYYWKVKAYNAADSSIFSTQFMFTTLEDIPAVPALLSPEDGGNIYETNALTWQPAARARSYNLQISTASDFSNVVFIQSGITATTFALSGPFSSSEYYWRVSATNARGTSAYSVSRRFITGPTVPAAPMLLSPAQGATGVSQNVTLSWNLSTNADYYAVQVATNSTFTNKVVDVSDIYTTTYTVSGLAANTMYYWRVRALNGMGASSYSTIRSFTTVAGVPVAPVLNTPADNATNIPTSTNITWYTVSGATSFAVQVSTNSSFTGLIVNQAGLTTTTYNLSLAPGTDYYWRVSASNGYGSSGYSAARKFTTANTVPAAPVLSSPADLATNVPISTKMSWNRVTGATSYNIQISESAGFLTFFTNATGITDTFYNVTGLRAGIVYYWKVSATNSYGTGFTSTVRSFTTSTVRYGNVTGSGTVSASDAVEALRMSVGILTSAWVPTFTYTLTHYMLADVDNRHTDGFVTGPYGVSAYDAYKILWKSLNPSVNLLPIEGGPAKMAASSGVLSLGTMEAKGGSETVSIPLNITNAMNVNSISFELNYDKSKAEITGVTSSLPKDWLIASVNENGKTRIVMAGITPVSDSKLASVILRIRNKEDKVEISGQASVNESEAQNLNTMTANRIPDLYVLNQNYPNPFNPTTNISFSIPSESNVKIVVFNTLGQVVKELVNEVRKAGYYETVFNASGLSSGIYYCSMSSKAVDGSNTFSTVRKLILMK